MNAKAVKSSLQPASSTLRRSLALYSALYRLLYPKSDEEPSGRSTPASESFHWLLMRLSEFDPDTCCATLETLNELSGQMSRSRKSHLFPGRVDLGEALYKLMSVEDTKIKVAAQLFFYSILEDSNAAPILSSLAITTSITDLLWSDATTAYGSPSLTESALCAHGKMLSYRIRTQGFSHSLNEEIEKHLILMQRLLHESNVSLTVRSICALRVKLMKSSHSQPDMQLFCH